MGPGGYRPFAPRPRPKVPTNKYSKGTPTNPTPLRRAGGTPVPDGGGNGGFQPFSAQVLAQTPQVTGSGADQAEKDFLEQWAAAQQQNPQQPGPSPTGPSSGRRSYGDGGAARARAQARADAIAENARLDKFYGTVSAAGAKDQAAAQAAMQAYDQYASKLGNPYAAIGPARAAQVDPSALSNLILSQGGGDAGLQAQAQFLQAQNGSQARASDRLAQMLAANQGAWNQSARTEGKLSGQQTQAEIAAQLLALKAAIEKQKVTVPK